jgi:phosphoglycolate phosphatase-like HAD superfamily hydrolase
VATAWPDPERILRADAEALGLAAHLDVLVFGPDNLARACAELGVEPAAVLFVGDSLGDVQRAAASGMTTAQALWFRADDTPGIEADFQVFTAVDVVSIVRRLTAA